MRSSPTSSARRLQAIDAGQLALPFLVEAELPAGSASNGPSDGIRSSCPQRRSAETSPPKNPKALELREPKREESLRERKPPTRTSVPLDARLLVSRKVASEMLTISIRKVDYMIADGRLLTRRIDNRVLIPLEEIRKFARSDHPRRKAG